EAVRSHFRPEFLNRVDDIVVFSRLSREQLREIVEIQLEGLRRRLADRRLGLDVTPAAMDLLADLGYDPSYGARPLKRVIQSRLADRIAMAVLEGRFTEDSVVTVGVEGDELDIGEAAPASTTGPPGV
ncbi:MAG: hypothetical protein OEW91_00085, partial [Acidimicrobiia bacterium]|nr:hypothetical protein [Acidimicrobiia bacterium]